MTAQEELDALARNNGWHVSTRPGESVYTRSLETVTLVFDSEGKGLTMSRTVPAPALGPDWKGRVGNILRHRWRTEGQQ